VYGSGDHRRSAIEDRAIEEHRCTEYRYRYIGHRTTSSIASSGATRGDGRYLDAL